jgi:hypothetical protein
MICWFENVGSDTSTNRIVCYTVSFRSPTGNGIEVHPANFRNFVAFSFCKSDIIIPQANWLAHGNRYLIPHKSQS